MHVYQITCGQMQYRYQASISQYCLTLHPEDRPYYIFTLTRTHTNIMFTITNYVKWILMRFFPLWTFIVKIEQHANIAISGEHTIENNLKTWKENCLQRSEIGYLRHNQVIYKNNQTFVDLFWKSFHYYSHRRITFV